MTRKFEGHSFVISTVIGYLINLSPSNLWETILWVVNTVSDCIILIIKGLWCVYRKFRLNCWLFAKWWCHLDFPVTFMISLTYNNLDTVQPMTSILTGWWNFRCCYHTKRLQPWQKVAWWFIGCFCVYASLVKKNMQSDGLYVYLVFVNLCVYVSIH